MFQGEPKRRRRRVQNPDSITPPTATSDTGPPGGFKKGHDERRFLPGARTSSPPALGEAQASLGDLKADLLAILRDPATRKALLREVKADPLRCVGMLRDLGRLEAAAGPDQEDLSREWTITGLPAAARFGQDDLEKMKAERDVALVKITELEKALTTAQAAARPNRADGPSSGRSAPRAQPGASAGLCIGGMSEAPAPGWTEVTSMAGVRGR